MKEYYGTQYKMNYNQSRPKLCPNLDLSKFRSTQSIVQKTRPSSVWDEYTNPMTRVESAHIIKFVVGRVLKALPTDNARLFFLQSELLAPQSLKNINKINGISPWTEDMNMIIIAKSKDNLNY